MSEIPYQIKPQVEQLRQERANCVAYGNDARVEKIDRQLADLGVKAEAAEERAAAASADDGDAAKSKLPQGRSSKPQSKTVAAGTAEGSGEA